MKFFLYAYLELRVIIDSMLQIIRLSQQINEVCLPKIACYPWLHITESRFYYNTIMTLYLFAYLKLRVILDFILQQNKHFKFKLFLYFFQNNVM